jgi:hypothetical protein
MLNVNQSEDRIETIQWRFIQIRFPRLWLIPRREYGPQVKQADRP